MTEEETPQTESENETYQQPEQQEAPAVEEEPQQATEKKPKPAGSRWHRFTNWYVSHKKWSISLTILALLVILAAVPWTRYSLGGLIIKRDFSVKVVDAATNTPVSGVTVTSGAISSQTDNNGKATLHKLKVGKKDVSFSKKYYKDTSATEFVPILQQKNIPTVSMVATGRQVKINVANLISKQALPNVLIKTAGTEAKTDKNGSATIVVPAGPASVEATLSLSGYNDATVTIKISNDAIAENKYTLTPAGRVYFLSKLSGKIDVVKTNLDGTDRQVVLAGTGKEDEANTVLLASRDWKYLALLSRRAGNAASLYLIDTTNSDSLSTIDEGNAYFNLVGWSDDKFVYTVGRNDYQPWQPKAASIKSFNAQSKKLSILDSTNATGTNNSDANYETYIINPILIDDTIFFTKTWYRYPGYLQVSGQSNTLNMMNSDGSGKKIIKSYDADKSYFGSMVFHNPNSIYIQVSNSDGSNPSFFELNKNGNLSQKDELTYQDIFKTYPTYLESPDDKSTFWAESRDGKNTLFIGDENGASGKQIATLSDYLTYGWYTNNYLLVSKNSSELYIMPVSGSDSPIKVSDYHKPSLSYAGYGGGYGGL